MSESTVSNPVVPTHLAHLISAQGLKTIDHWIAKYPTDQRQSAVMAALMVVQEELGSLTPSMMDAVAVYLNMPPIAVYEVSTFYTMYEHKPCGRNIINICTNISCKLRDSAAVVRHLESKLGIHLGETTADGRFSLRSVECLGACVNAPMIQINKDYHEQLTAEKIDTVLEQYQ